MASGESSVPLKSVLKVLKGQFTQRSEILNVCVCACVWVCMCVFNGHDVCYMQYKPYYCDFSCCKCVCVFMQLYAVLYINVHACARTRHEYMQKCAVLYVGLTMRAHVQSPPAGTIITARAHSRQLSPGGPWLRPAWRDAAWLTVEPGSALPPPSHIHTNVQQYDACAQHITSILQYHTEKGACMCTLEMLFKKYEWTL